MPCNNKEKTTADTGRKTGLKHCVYTSTCDGRMRLQQGWKNLGFYQAFVVFRFGRF